MLIKTYNIETLDKYFFVTTKVILGFLGSLSVLSILINWDVSVAIPTFGIFMTTTIFISLPQFRRNVFSIALIFWLFVYIFVPLTYASILGENYIFGWGLLEIPFDQEVYKNRYTLNLYFLLGCLISTFTCLTLFKTNSHLLKTEMQLKSFGIWPIVFLGMIVFYILIQDILISLAAKSASEAGSEGLIKFLFFDHAYLFIAGISLFSLDKDSFYFEDKQKKAIIFIAFLFVFAGMLAGSKASWLGIVYFYFLTAYSYIRTNQNNLILFPSISLAVVVIIIAPLLYFGTFFYRIALTSSYEFNIFNIITLLDVSALSLLAEEIFYRLSAGGFDRFMLISTSFVSNEISLYGVQEYLPYMLKNFSNLALPGTPYAEAYAPTSQLYPEAIKMAPLDGDVSQSFLLRSINSQAYTIFGVMTIIGGWMAPVLIFLYNFIFCFTYSLARHLFIRMTLIYFYFTSIASFGFEVAAGYSYHVIICFFFMYYFLLALSKIKLGFGLKNNT